MLTLGMLCLVLALYLSARLAYARPPRGSDRPVAYTELAPLDPGTSELLARVSAAIDADARIPAAGHCETEVLDIRGVMRARGPDGRERLVVAAVRHRGGAGVPLVLDAPPGAMAAASRSLIGPFEAPGDPTTATRPSTA